MAVVLVVAWLLWPRTAVTEANAIRIERCMTRADVKRSSVSTPAGGVADGRTGSEGIEA
jgi:hypothetical protein